MTGPCRVTLLSLLLTVPCACTSGPGTVSPAGGPPATLAFHIAGMTCGSCAAAVENALAAVPGVQQAKADPTSGRAEVRTDGRPTRASIREALARLGFEARFSGETGATPLAGTARAAADVKTVSHGRGIRVAEHLGPGKITLFEYYADWCGPCRLLAPRLERLAAEHPEVAVRRVDIVDWQSEAARQATREFRLPGLPCTRIFDSRGHLLGQVYGNHLDRIEAIVRGHVKGNR